MLKTLYKIARTGLVTEPAPEADALRQEAQDRAATEPDFEGSINAVRRWGHEENFAISAQLVLGLIAPADAARRFTRIAEAAISACLGAAERQTALKFGPPPGMLALIAQGRLGASEMTAASDIDIMFVYDAPGAADAPAYYGRLVRRAVAAIASPSDEGALYEVDMQLRPSGSKGPVAVSFPAFERYYRADAWTWEKMALVKARTIAGSADLCARLDADVAAILAQPRDARKTLRDIDDMRESPALSIIDLLRSRGAEISYHDPFVAEVTFDHAYTIGAGDPLYNQELTDDLIKSADCVIICTEHSGIDYKRVCELAPLIVDTRNALNEDIRNGSNAKIVRL